MISNGDLLGRSATVPLDRVSRIRNILVPVLIDAGFVSLFCTALLLKCAVFRNLGPGHRRKSVTSAKFSSGRPRREFAAGFFRFGGLAGGDINLDAHAQVVGPNADPGTVERYCLARIAHH